MTRWNQFVAMAVGQLAGRCSLRDIVSNLSAQGRKLLISDTHRPALRSASKSAPGTSRSRLSQFDAT